MSGAPSAMHETAHSFALSNLPPRVRQLLAGIFDIAVPEFERIVNASLNELEQQLFSFAERGASPAEEVRWLEAQNLVKRNRQSLLPGIRAGLASELARLRDPVSGDAGTGPGAGGIGIGAGFSLATKVDVDESSVVAEMSNRVEMRNNLPLYLLGQRLGVLAGKPGLGSEAIPIGPQAFCRLLRESSECLGLSPEHRRLLFKVAERQMMIGYGEIINAANAYLASNTILPDFEYMPTRARQKSQSEPPPRPTPSQHSPGPAGGGDVAHPWQDPRADSRLVRPRVAGRAEPRPGPEMDDAPASRPALHGADLPARHVHVPQELRLEPGPMVNEAAGHAEVPEGEANFHLMRQLLASRNELLAKLKPGPPREHNRTEPVPTHLVQDNLRILQRSLALPADSAGRTGPRNIQHVKQDLLARLQANSGSPEMSTLNDEDNDVIDLVDMLFESIGRDTRLDSLAAQLLEKLQVPLLRVALQDRGFFYERNHPAKELLDAIAESGAYWLGDDDADPALLGKMNAVVDRTVREFDGDITLFRQLSQDINSHLQLLTHKAEVAERRHVEAARGKEKLAQAREEAATAMKRMLSTASLPSFTSALLGEAWTDVLALTSLRHGQGGSAWHHQLDVAKQLIRTAQAPPGESVVSADVARELRKELAESLSQVGYQEDEIEAIALKLIQPHLVQEPTSAGSLELAKRLGSRARFGADSIAAKETEAPLTEAERACYEKFKTIAFGTWFEFATNQQGDRVRQRLAWFSTTTGHALFVNKRGQKMGEYQLTTLARRMAQGEVSAVEEKPGSIIDRAWRSVMAGLRSFAGQPMAAGAAR